MNKLKDKMKKNIRKHVRNDRDRTLSLISENRKLKKQIEEGRFDISRNVPTDIKEITNELHKLMSNRIANTYQIGLRLLKVHTNRLYKKVTESFEEYVEDYVGISKKSAYRFLFIAENFDDVSALTHGSKLELLQPIWINGNKKLKDEVIKWLNDEKPSYRQVIDYVKEISKNIEDNNNSNKNIKTIIPKRVVYKAGKYTINVKKMDVKVKDKFKQELELYLKELCEKYGIK